MAKHPGDDSRKKQKKTAPLTPAPNAQNEAPLDHTQAVPVSRDTRRTSAVPAAKPRAKAAAHTGTRKTRAVKARPHSIFKPRTRQPNFALSVAVTTINMIIVLVLCVCLAGLGALIGIAKAYVDTAPTLDLAALNEQDKTSFIYDAQGNLITDYKGTEDRVMVSIDEIPVMLRNAFIAVEDARFYEHNGVDVKRIVGALVANFATGSSQGGSTITQ